jgi:hypothetical protein
MTKSWRKAKARMTTTLPMGAMKRSMKMRSLKKKRSMSMRRR